MTNDESNRLSGHFATHAGVTLEKARAQLWPPSTALAARISHHAAQRKLAPRVQNFDVTGLPLFGDGHRQKELF